MVYTKIFKFGSKTLNLKSLEDINVEVEKSIQFILDKFTVELNHNVKNTSARKLNEAELNIPINLSKEYVDFLDYNLDFATNFDGFTPFTIDDSSSFKTLNQLYIKDSTKSRVVKLKKFKLDTSFLRSSYIIELLKKFLKESSIVNYSIVVPNIIIASGSYKWESMFIESDEFKNRAFQLKNSSALLIQDVNSKDIILAGKDLSLIKALEKTVKNMQHDREFKNVSKKFGVDIILVRDSNVIIFQGMN